MKQWHRLNLVMVIGILSIAVLLCNQCSKKVWKTEQSSSLSNLLPKPTGLKNWQPSNTAQEYVGEDLFLLVNGGAAKYYEYGFIRVIVQEYQNKKDNRIVLEIFEMKDPEAARKIFSYKTGGKGEKIEVGDDAFWGNYYLYFRRGSFLVTLTGYDTEKMTFAGLKMIAIGVDARIKEY